MKLRAIRPSASEAWARMPRMVSLASPRDSSSSTSERASRRQTPTVEAVRSTASSAPRPTPKSALWASALPK